MCLLDRYGVNRESENDQTYDIYKKWVAKKVFSFSATRFL